MLRPNLSQQERARLYSSDEPVALAGRKIIASLLTPLLIHEQDLTATAGVASVHESRKGMRRLRTALNLFAPYYEPGVLAGYRKRFRKMMRRLASSRDAAVFLIKLDQYIGENFRLQELHSAEETALSSLQSYWLMQQSAVDERLLRYLAKGKYRALLSELERFGHSAGQDERSSEVAGDIIRIGHVAPAMIDGRVAAVRSCADSIETASLKRLHALRIQCKEMRHTLEFFEPVMGPPAGELVEILKQLLTHLGDLNDARVHLKLLGQTPQEEVGEGVAIYLGVKETELKRLIADLPIVWAEIGEPAWRRQLAAAVSSL
jgi:CHAD domain-containing protein